MSPAKAHEQPWSNLRLDINAFMLAGTIAVSALSYELFEKQFIALKDRWFRKDGAELRPASRRAGESQASAPASAG